MDVRNTVRRSTLAACLLFASGATHPSLAATPEDSLADCAATVSSVAAKYARRYAATVGRCLEGVASGDAADDESSRKLGTRCTRDLRRLRNSDAPEKTLAGRAAARIRAACDPKSGGAKVLHTEIDVVGSASGGTTVAEPLWAANLGDWCSALATSPEVQDVDDWADCIVATAELAGRELLVAAHPRIVLMSRQLVAAILELDIDCADCIDCENQVVTDACFLADGIGRAADGAVADLVPDPWCFEIHDASNDTCRQLQSGQFQCSAADEWSSCPGDWPGMQDGDTRIGVQRSLTNNGDGTVTDNRTGLMWEVLCDDDEPFDVCPEAQDEDTRLDWQGAFAKVEAMNAGGLAGYDDWRLPNVTELHTISFYRPIETEPAIHPIFEDDCDRPCSADQCACTPPGDFWTSTTYVEDPEDAWFVGTNILIVANKNKTDAARVRLVRDATGS